MHRCGLDVVAAHLHHGQREEAEKEMLLAEAWCNELGVPFVVGRADVPRLASDHKLSLEEAGRHARYHFFEQAAFRLECRWIVTAHTQDDQIETLLFHLLRGTGLAGLRGIPQQRGRICRPLLDFTRAETHAYCDHHGLWTVDDPANTDPTFARARMRHRILPELEQIQPGFRQNLLRFAEIAGEEDEFLERAAAALLEQAERPLNGPLQFLTQNEELALDRGYLRSAPEVLGKRGLRLAAEVVGSRLEREGTQRLWLQIQSDQTGSEGLPGGQAVVEWSAETVHFRSLQEVEPFRFAVTVPGETVADVFGWQIEAWHEPEAEPIDDPTWMDLSLDPDQLQGTLYFRRAQAGEKIQPLGMEGTKLISDLYQERRLTALARRKLPVVCDFLGPVWIPGVVLADRVKLKSSSVRRMRLRFRPIGSGNDHNDMNA